MSKYTRSLKILNLLKNSDSCKADKENTVDNYQNKSLEPVAVIQEHGVLSPLPPQTLSQLTSRTSSPLPLGAENIYSALKDVIVCEDVFNEEQNIHTPFSSPKHKSPANQDDNISLNNELTPFVLEVPTSYECSPLININDLERGELLRSSHSSPINLLTLPTPMPSPLNRHTSCVNEFCAQHENRTFIASSPSVIYLNSPATSNSNSSVESPRSGKKRQRRVNEWSDVKRKCLKNLGQKYVTKKGDMKDEKTLGQPCKCRYKCTMNISHQQRIYCFTKFWQLGNKEKQWDFIIKYSEKLKKKRCLNQDTPNNRKYTYKYYLPLISDTERLQHERIAVCQTMFVNTLSISTRILRTAWKKYDGSTSVESDQRGRHDNHKRIITDVMIQSVCDHVRSFVPVESHYIRKDSKKLYLDGGLSIARMHKLYLEWFDPTKYTTKATERQYRDIINSNFNLAFHVPKKDQCDDCHIFKHKRNPTEEEKNMYTKHQERKKVARSLKSQDKQDATHSNGKIVTAVFDFEKVLTCPHGEVSTFYYKRKLSCLNFTIYDMGNKKATCYMWDETVAKRGANEVSSCLLDFIETNAVSGVQEFRFWSDNCTGQNRNRIVFSLYVYAAKKYNVTITHRFLEKGHTQNEGDSVHSVIERASKGKILYTPDEWRLLARWAKVEGESYDVTNMTQRYFYDFKSNVNNKAWQKNIKGHKIAWNNIKEVHVNSNEPNKLYYRFDLTDAQSDVLVLRGNTRRSVQTELRLAYSELLKMSIEKYKDLIRMCEYGTIPSDYHEYFRNLPHHTIVQESEESGDQSE